MPLVTKTRIPLGFRHLLQAILDVVTRLVASSERRQQLAWG